MSGLLMPWSFAGALVRGGVGISLFIDGEPLTIDGVEVLI